MSTYTFSGTVAAVTSGLAATSGSAPTVRLVPAAGEVVSGGDIMIGSRALTLDAAGAFTTVAPSGFYWVEIHYYDVGAQKMTQWRSDTFNLNTNLNLSDIVTTASTGDYVLTGDLSSILNASPVSPGGYPLSAYVLPDGALDDGGVIRVASSPLTVDSNGEFSNTLPGGRYRVLSRYYHPSTRQMQVWSTDPFDFAGDQDLSLAIMRSIPITHGRQIEAANTGLAGAGISEGSLAALGATTYSTSGVTITGKTFSGTVTLNGNNITLKGCKVQLGGLNSIGVRVNGANCVVEDCTITSATGFFCGISVSGDGTRIKRCDVSKGENIVTLAANDVVVEESYLHDVNLLSDPAGHPDVIEVFAGTNVTIRKNRIKMWTSNAAPINIAPFFGAVSVTNCTIDDNWIDGGQVHIIVDLQSSGTITYTRVRRNDFGGHTSIADYSALQDNDGRGKATSEALLLATPTKILWPSTGDDVNRWANTSPLSPNLDGQIVT